jgi:pimeloyl-ACP methyl ester carboxylesterase
MVDDLALVHCYANAAPVARAREVAKLAPRGRWAELEHSAHVAWLEEPARLRELLRAFIREPLGR